MLRDYRDWLRAELELLGNASHHAYAFGQANMAKRAIEKLDQALSTMCVVTLDDPSVARRALTELELLNGRETSLTPGLSALRAALEEALLPADESV